MTDPFATAAVRDRVLAGWTAAAVRLREDANAEEDLALGGYRGRLVVELAQNAADAAARAGVPGRLSFTLCRPDDGPGVLVAANTGAPLTAAGVQSLATLRASAKTDDAASVGRFGVGFAAVLAVTDEPMVLSRTGGVRFSRDDTADLVNRAAQASPDLADELRRRGGHVPVLRLPFPAEGVVPDGYDTAVVLPLRDDAAAEIVRDQLDAADDALLLALPALAEVRLDVHGGVRTLAGARERWYVLEREGRWTAEERHALLGDRPTEERRSLGWRVLWALPRSADAVVPRTVHAPTATDEPSSLPALLLASFPLDPTRRHVQPGPLADRVADEAAAAYVDLLRERARAGDDVLRLVPVGPGAGALDAALRERVLTRLPDAPVLHAVEDGTLVRPRDAVTLDGAAGDTPGVLATLAPLLSGLVAAPRFGRSALRALGVSLLGLSDLVEMLPDAATPEVWHERYEGLAPLADDPAAREALAALPVPLTDGRTVRGARGLLVLDAGPPVGGLTALGLRVVQAAAAHPLLLRLGAVAATARSLLENPATEAAVRASPDADDPDEVAAAVLGLVESAVADGSLRPGELPWLGLLALRDVEGDLAPASALALPGSEAARLLDPEEIREPAADLLDRWSRAALTAVGVLDGLGVAVAADVDLDAPPEDLAELDGFEEWAREAVAAGGVSAGELLAVRDLDVVRDGAWPQLLAHLASDPVLRRAMIEDVRVRDPRGAGRQLPSYTTWWLRRELALEGTVVTGASDVLDGLLDPAPSWVADLDPEMRRALGVLDGAVDAAMSPQVLATLLDRTSDHSREVSVGTCLALWRQLAEARLEGVEPPDRLRVLVGDGTQVVDAERAVVADDPRWLQRPDLGGIVVAPAGAAPALADLLDVALASDLAAGRVDQAGTSSPVPAAVRDVLPGAPASWCEHDELSVDGQPVDWWVDEDGGLHAATTDGLARALAWSTGRWAQRHLVAAVLADPADAVRLAVEAAAE
ncbi:MAG TPA: hypothetical protein VKB14_10545 [Actinomycetales bacterium]|nr:hypothetical protein [Actinomycetales bacterium]